MTIVEQLLKKYASATAEAQNLALREVMQRVALAALNRTGFFEQAGEESLCCRISRAVKNQNSQP